MRRRRLADRVFWGAASLAFALIAAPAVSVVVSVFHQAAPAVGWSLFLEDTSSLGIQNALLGTLMLLLGVLVVAGTVGVAAGIYLAEFAGGRTGHVLRFFSEVLAGAPSIVIGFVGYTVLVVEFHWGNSLLAAVLALSVLVLPYIVKTTEVALRQVPTSLREAATGLGTPRWTTVRRVTLPVACPAVVTGLVMALAISTGETAPLLFTGGWSDQTPTLHLFRHPITYLTGVTYFGISEPGARAHATAAAAAAVSLVMLLLLILIGHRVSARARRQTERMHL